ncbi:MAG: transcriptional regulator [Bradyrhizobiaceae bacterium PARB1]|uniref:MerR family transcriptional regulator n=1 Tax=Tardiphaga sp. TaxID=1926292 RepID=UPI000BD2C60A|nr:MAG: transcriptional regulator [Bradyrhizobiaceae bacterium PARB1]
MISIGALSKASGVHIETIRYYERSGLLPKPARATNGRRVYDDGDVRRLLFIRHARDLGFDLGAVRDLLQLQEQPNQSCNGAWRLASAHLEAVEGRLRLLETLRAELTRMVASCRYGRVSECHVIDALATPQFGPSAGIANCRSL